MYEDQTLPDPLDIHLDFWQKQAREQIPKRFENELDTMCVNYFLSNYNFILSDSGLEWFLKI